MDQLKIEVRKARPAEGRFIARCVMSAIGMPVFSRDFSRKDFDILEVLSGACAMPDTLYSYRNTLVATVGDIPVGCIVAYDGARYEKMKGKTFAMVKEKTGYEFKSDFENETEAGEYYLDSLCVLPSFRGHGIGKLLISQSLETAEGLGFPIATLIVESGNDFLQEYYRDCGFEPEGKKACFGKDFTRMVCHVS